jgi:hypothetical protein
MNKVYYSGQCLMTGMSTIKLTGVTRVSRLSSVIVTLIPQPKPPIRVDSIKIVKFHSR